MHVLLFTNQPTSSNGECTYYCLLTSRPVLTVNAHTIVYYTSDQWYLRNFPKIQVFSCRNFVLFPIILLKIPISPFSQCSIGRGMCYPGCGMMHIKVPLLLIGKSSPCGGNGYPLLLSEWSFTIVPTPYNHK